MFRAGRFTLLAAAALCVPAPPATPQSTKDAGKPTTAKVEVRRPKAIEVLKAPPAGLESGGTAIFKAKLKGGYVAPWVVVTDPRGDVFFPEPDRIRLDGGTLTCTLDFPGEDGRFRVDVLASGKRGEEAIASFHISVGVQPRPASEDHRPAEVPPPGLPSGPPPPSNGSGPTGGERLLMNRRAASIACIEELSRVRKLKGLKPVVHDQRIHVVCMESAREMGNKGRFGAGELKYSPGTRASIFHGWGIGMYDNYTGAYKTIFSPKDTIKRLGGSLAKGSMFGRGGVNVGGFGFWEDRKNPAQVFIVMGLARISKLNRILAAQARVAKARQELADASSAVRVRLVRGVANMRSMEAAPFLAELLAGAPEPDIRTAAAAGLQALGDPSVVEPLIDALTGTDEKVDSSVGRALQRITGRRFGKDQRKWRAWWDIERDFFRRRR